MSFTQDPTDSNDVQFLIGSIADNEPIEGNAVNSEAEREWLGQVAGLLHDHYFAGEIEKAQKDLDFFKTLAKNEKTDPGLGNTETSACRGILKLAEYCCDQLRFSVCLEICESVKDVLDAKRARYIHQGLAPESDSMAWLALITNLAECKWKNPELCKDAVINLDDMVQQYISLELHIRQRLVEVVASNPEKTNLLKTTIYLDGLATCGTFLLGALSRYQPSENSDLENFINFLHEGRLSDSSCPNSWHLLIIKEFYSPQPSLSRINECYIQLRKTVKKWFGSGFNSHAFDIASSIEQEFLKRQICHS